MKKSQENTSSEELNTLVDLMRTLVAIEMWKHGATQQQIAKRLVVAKSKVVEMLSGLEK